MSALLIWFLIGVAFLIAELFAPGFILAFFMVGSWITALVLLIFRVDVTIQLLIFVSSSLISLFLLREYCIRIFKGKTAEGVDEDIAASKIGKIALVTKRIGPRAPGEVKAVGSFWKAVSDQNIEEGKPVRIVGQEAGDSLTLIVKPFVEEQDD
jgi:membrane protein implicated in regulation of membrane protease activity